MNRHLPRDFRWNVDDDGSLHETVLRSDSSARTNSHKRNCPRQIPRINRMLTVRYMNGGSNLAYLSRLGMIIESAALVILEEGHDLAQLHVPLLVLRIDLLPH